MTDTKKRNEVGRIAYTVVRSHKARYSTRLGPGEEIYAWSSSESAREFFYLCWLKGHEVLTDVHNNVTVDISVKAIDLHV